MLNEDQSIAALIEGIKGTTGFLSGFFSRKSGLIFLFIVFSVIVSKFLID